MHLCLSSVIELAPHLRHALISKETTPVLGGFQTPIGITQEKEYFSVVGA